MTCIRVPGGAPEGVLAAAALRCIGGQMQGRLVTSVEEQKARAATMGVKDFNKKYTMNEMASGDVIFAATGVTDGWLLDGVHHVNGGVTTHTIVMRSATGTVRRLNSFPRISRSSARGRKLARRRGVRGVDETFPRRRPVRHGPRLGEPSGRRPAGAGHRAARGLPEIVARVLAGRGVAPEDCAAYLAPSLKNLMPDPRVLVDMEKAASRVARAIMDGEKVAVFGDYDVDGATSSALLYRFFRAAGRELRVYIPDRIREGYGPNAPALLKLKREGIGLVVTVDCGTMAHKALGLAADAGLPSVVIDHHQAEPALPPAYALVNPNRLDDESGLGQLAQRSALLALCRRDQPGAAGRATMPAATSPIDAMARPRGARHGLATSCR